jgi:MerR family transcriptional regulator/heat shock protein HspR
MVSDGWEDGAPRFVISVAAQLAQMHPQTLRQYDKLGLVVPGRASGRGRRYSSRDIEVLRQVQRLSAEEGINLAGIRRILALEAEVRDLRAQVDYLRAHLGRDRRVFTVHPEGEAETVHTGRRRAGGSPSAGPGGYSGEPEAADQASEPPSSATALIIWRSGQG